MSCCAWPKAKNRIHRAQGWHPDSDGTPDPDCPSCVQSIRYLCTKKKDVSEKEKVEQKGEAKIKVQATPGAMGTLLSLNSIPGKRGNTTGC